MRLALLGDIFYLLKEQDSQAVDICYDMDRKIDLQGYHAASWDIEMHQLKGIHW